MVTWCADEAYLPKCIASSFQSGQQSIMLWGAIASGKKGPLICIEKTPYCTNKYGCQTGGGLNSQGYANQILSGPFFEFWREMREERGQEMLIVEDRAPCHKGSATKQVQESLGIHQLSHPPSSPDLNPIESIWRLLKSHIFKIQGAQRNPETLCSSASLGFHYT